jgi:DNA-binding transcriptional LysR family regulator
MAMPDEDHPLLVSVPLCDPVVKRTVGVIRRKGRSLSPAAQQLHAFLMEMESMSGRPTAGD